MRCDTGRGRRILAEAGRPRRRDVAPWSASPPSWSRACWRRRRGASRCSGRRPGWSHVPTGPASSPCWPTAAPPRSFDAHDRRAPPDHARRLACGATRIHDALDDVGLLLVPHRLPDRLRTARRLRALLHRRVRHVRQARAGLVRHARAGAVAQGGPRLGLRRAATRCASACPFSFLITPTSPLTIEHDYTQSWLELRDYGLPVAVMPMPLQGATAPGSRLGTLLAANCETIGTLCLVQAAAPGTPVFYAPVVATHGPAHRSLRGRRHRARRALRGGHRDGALLRPAGRVLGPLHADLRAGPADRLGEGERRACSSRSSTPDVLVGPGLLGGATILCLEQIVLDVEVSRIARQAQTGVPVRDDLWLDEILRRGRPVRLVPRRALDARRRARRGVGAQRLRRARQLGRLADGGLADARVAAARERVDAAPRRPGLAAATATTRRRPSRRSSAAPTPPPDPAASDARRGRCRLSRPAARGAGQSPSAS